ncbi:MAG TPA: hydrogenase/urease maturation nickel metallochaperone HypA [Gemmatimonadaceae bacterium]|nr:hydrogenase/urease maturation nickel metallochaperone HypA [Gemmatimonadaceae bacterium]
MHEMSLALDVCGITERAIGTRSPSLVREVVLDIGDNAGVDPDNFEFCLTALLQSPPFGAAKPVLRRHAGSVLRVAHIEVEECP